MLAIVGRPNVGKSTLFNRLVGQRRAIVGDEPGITRDRLYGYAEWNGKRLRVIDTGGIIPDDEALIPAEIFRQAKVALEEADVIVMVVDGRSNLASSDIDLARLLQRTGKPLILAVNKIDDPKLESYVEDFRRLGIRTMMPISAENATGVAELLEEVLERIPEKSAGNEAVADEGAVNEVSDALANEIYSDLDTEIDDELHPGEEEPDDQASPEVKIAIIGRPNVGKSTLLNRLTGTARAIVSPIAGTTRDAVDEVVERDGQTFRFIDTAGIRRKGKTHLMAEKLSVVMARKHLEAADLALVVIDANEGVTALDATIAGYAHEAGRSIVVVINKWDAVTIHRTDSKPAAKMDVYEEQAREHLKFLNTLATSAIQQLAIVEYLTHDGWDQHLRRVRQTLAQRADIMISAVRRFFPAETRLSRPQGGYLLWLELPKQVDTMKVYHAALDRKITIAPGRMYSNSNLYSSCLRLNYSYAWAGEIENAVKELGRIVDAQSRA